MRGNNQWWANWKNSQDWSPPHNQHQDRRAKHNATWKKEYSECLQQVQSEIAAPQGLDDAASQPSAPRNPQPEFTETEAQIEQKKKTAAIRIKAALAYKASLDPAATSLHALIDAELKESRALTSTGKSLGASLDEATQAHAASRVKVQRAMRHLSEAKERYDRAIAEQLQTQQELDEVRSYSSRSSSERVRGVCQTAVQSMASTLSNLRQAASFTEPGKVHVDATLLETLAAQVASLAHDTSPKRPTRSVRRRLEEITEIEDSDNALTDGLQYASATDDPYAGMTVDEEDPDLTDSAVASFFQSMKNGRAPAPKPSRRAAGSVFRKPVDKPSITKANGGKRIPRRMTEVVAISTPTRTEDQIAAAAARLSAGGDSN